MSSYCITPKGAYLYTLASDIGDLSEEKLQEAILISAQERQRKADAKEREHAIRFNEWAEDRARKSNNPAHWELHHILKAEPEVKPLKLTLEQLQLRGVALGELPKMEAIKYTDQRTGKPAEYFEVKRKLFMYEIPEDQLKQNGVMPYPEEVQIGCNQCFGCQKRKARQWATRCALEAMCHRENCFITLTFNNDALFSPERGVGYTLNPRDLQIFMKRLRNQIKKLHYKKMQSGKVKLGSPVPPIKMFAAGEMGGRNGRPHYHVLIFGWSPPDKSRSALGMPPGMERRELTKNEVMESIRKMTSMTKAEAAIAKQSISKYYKSNIVDECWQHQGNIEIGDVTIETAAYCAAYSTKKYKDTQIDAIELFQAEDSGIVSPILINEEWLIRKRDEIQERYSRYDGTEQYENSIYKRGYDPLKPYELLLQAKPTDLIADWEIPQEQDKKQYRDDVVNRVRRLVDRIDQRDRAEHELMLTPDENGDALETIANYEIMRIVNETDINNAIRGCKEYIRTDDGEMPDRYDMAGELIERFTQRNAIPPKENDPSGFYFDPDDSTHIMNARTGYSLRYRRWASQERKCFKVFSRVHAYAVVEQLPSRSKARKIMESLGTKDIRLATWKKANGDIEYYNIETGVKHIDQTDKPNRDLQRARLIHSRMIMRFVSEYHQTSKRPGIAANFYEKYRNDLFGQILSDNAKPPSVVLLAKNAKSGKKNMQAARDCETDNGMPVPEFIWQKLKQDDPRWFEEQRQLVVQAAEDYQETEAYKQSQKPPIKIAKYLEQMQKNVRHYDEGHYGGESVPATLMPIAQDGQNEQESPDDDEENSSQDTSHQIDQTAENCRESPQ